MTTYTPRPITLQTINEVMSPRTLTKKRGGPKGKAKDIVSLMDKWDYSRVDKIDVLDVVPSLEVFQVSYVIYSLESLVSTLEKPLYDQVFTNYLNVLVDFPDYIGNLPPDKFPLIQEEPYELFYIASKLHWLFCWLHPNHGKPIAEVLLQDEPLSLGLLTLIKDLPDKEIENLYEAIEESLY